MMMYVGHGLSFVVYIAIVITVLSGIVRLTQSCLYGLYRKFIWGFYVTLFCQAALFMALQYEWIYEDYNEVVGDVTAYAWLAFDYFNGFALLCFAVALNTYVGWKRVDDSSEFRYRGRKGDHPPP